MIKSKQDYNYFMTSDKKALGIKKISIIQQFKLIVFPNYIWNFQRRLRKFEYYKNCGKDVLGRILYLYHRKRLEVYSIKLGFSIPENVFGPVLAIIHYWSIVVNGRAKIGKNCRIHSSINIGVSGGSKQAHDYRR